MTTSTSGYLKTSEGLQRPTHEDLVRRLAKPGHLIAEQMSGQGAHLLHMVLGAAGEVGELIDAVKKAVIYRKELDLKNVIEELGDLEFYLQGLRDSLGITRQQTIDANIDKLLVRYGSTYSDKAAQERKDKA